jgi:hypothetical protein
MPVNGASFHNLSTAKVVTCLYRNNGFSWLSVSEIREEYFVILYSRKSVCQVGGNVLTLPLSSSPVWHILASQKWPLLGKFTIADSVFM